MTTQEQDFFLKNIDRIGQIEMTLARIDERLKKLEEAIVNLSQSLSGSYRDQVASCHQRFVDRVSVEALDKRLDAVEADKISRNEFTPVRLLVYGATFIALSTVGYKLLEILF